MRVVNLIDHLLKEISIFMKKKIQSKNESGKATDLHKIQLTRGFEKRASYHDFTLPKIP